MFSGWAFQSRMTLVWALGERSRSLPVVMG